jgi:2-polyprenyl-3-methyl-5-hydroxy-6-metoxy-1,4-benzoquinol methylase
MEDCNNELFEEIFKFFSKSRSKKIKNINNQNSVDLANSDQKFLKNAYREILGRDIDPDGLNYYIKFLQDGHSQTDVLLNLVKSEEFINKVLRENTSIQNLRQLRPSSYHVVADLFLPNKVLVFTAETDGDLDWLESMILEHGYYEKPGVWSFSIDTDKKVMAEIMSDFQPNRALEIGCANGTVMKCLYDMNILCEGIEISTRAINKAFPEIKNNIYKGDILELNLPEKYNLIFGLDVFEHLNPNRIADYINKIYQILIDGGYLFCNIPAFGCDPIFGTVFPVYIKEWEADISQGRYFSQLHVDAQGYPIHGHLIWADYQWWVKQFEQSGFQREVEIEKAFHEKYDDYMNKTSVARKSYFIFSKNADKKENEAIIDIIKSTPSQVLKSKKLELLIK